MKIERMLEIAKEEKCRYETTKKSCDKCIPDELIEFIEDIIEILEKLELKDPETCHETCPILEMYKSTVYDIAKTELKKFAKKVVDTCLCNKEEIDLVLGQFIKEMTK